MFWWIHQCKGCSTDTTNWGPRIFISKRTSWQRWTSKARIITWGRKRTRRPTNRWNGPWSRNASYGKRWHADECSCTNSDASEVSFTIDWWKGKRGSQSGIRGRTWEKWNTNPQDGASCWRAERINPGEARCTCWRTKVGRRRKRR